jgi:hypothetical protein
MTRVARVTAAPGRSDGGFYVEQPDIPEGLTCQDWRCRRVELRRAQRSMRRRPVLRWPASRVAMP